MSDSQINIIRGSTWPGFVVRCYSDAAKTVPFDGTGYTPKAQIRPEPGSQTLTYDLEPTWSDQGTGVATIPAIENADSADIAKGKYHWDFTLTNDGSGDTTEPLLKDDVIVKDKNTEPPL
jgi:hypothetical protein